MKINCVKCGHELEAKYGLDMKNCRGFGIIIEVRCAKCETLNRMQRLLDDVADQEEVKEFIDKRGNYIG